MSASLPRRNFPFSIIEPIMATTKGVEVIAKVPSGLEHVLSPAALDFIASLHREFEPTRQALIGRRVERQARLDGGEPMNITFFRMHGQSTTTASQ